MNKQIEEMAKIIVKNVYGLEQDVEYAPNARNASKELFSKGYRRQDEIATEILSEIEQAIMAHGTKYAMKRLEEIKKKYGVTEDEY